MSESSVFEDSQTEVRLVTIENRLKVNSEHLERELAKFVTGEEIPIYQGLKRYRYGTSKVEEVMAFYVFSNVQLEGLIDNMPKTIEELENISGFWDAIVGVVDKHRGIGV